MTVIDGNQNTSIVIVSYHTGAILLRCLESALNQHSVQEVIIVNNGNPEHMLEQLSQMAAYHPKLKIVTGHGNIGFGAGCNLGVKHATSKYIALLNPDAIMIDASSCVRLIEALESNSNAVIAGAKVVNPDATTQKTCIRNLLTPENAIAEGLTLYKISSACTGININTTEMPDETCQVPAITGAFMFLRKSDYDRLHGFDEAYFLHVEDLDLCYRIHQIGGKIIYVPSVKILHYLSTSNISSSFVERHKAQSFRIYFSKYFAKHSLFYPLIIVIYMRLWISITLSTVKKLFDKTKEDFTRKQGQFLVSNHQLGATSLVPHNTQPILLAGVTNQIGLCVAKRLLADDNMITALYHSNCPALYHRNISWIQADFTNQSLDLSAIKAKTLIYTSPLWLLPDLLGALTEVNLERLICFSSTSIFSKNFSQDPKERNTVRKLITAEKAIADICTKRHIKYTILRPTLIYGLGIDQNVSKLYRLIKKFGFCPIYGPADGQRQPVHADDLAIACLNIIDNTGSFDKAYNLCGGEKLPYSEMVGRIFDLLNKKRNMINITFLPYLLDIYGQLFNHQISGQMAKRMNEDLVFDDRDAKNDFAYAPRSYLANGLEDFGLFK